MDTSPTGDIVSTWEAQHAAGTFSYLTIRSYWRCKVPEIFSPQVIYH